MEFKLLKAHPYPVIGGMIGNLPIPSKERQGSLLAAILVESFNNSAPALTLAVIDLAKIQHRTLNDLASRTTPVLHYRPITMFLAVFPALRASQKHDGSQA